MTVSMVRVRFTGEDPGVGGGGAAPETAPASPAQGGPDHQVPPRRPHVRKNEADSDWDALHSKLGPWRPADEANAAGVTDTQMTDGRSGLFYKKVTRIKNETIL